MAGPREVTLIRTAARRITGAVKISPIKARTNSTAGFQRVYQQGANRPAPSSKGREGKARVLQVPTPLLTKPESTCGRNEDGPWKGRKESGKLLGISFFLWGRK